MEHATRLANGYYRYRGRDVFLENEGDMRGRWLVSSTEGGEFTADYPTKRAAMEAIDRSEQR